MKVVPVPTILLKLSERCSCYVEEPVKELEVRMQKDDTVGLPPAVKRISYRLCQISQGIYTLIYLSWSGS